MRWSGALTPSSRFLGAKMAGIAEAQKAALVVEFGAGTGSVTREILKLLPASGKLIAFEINEGFSKYLKQNIQDPRLTVIQKSPDSEPRLLEKLGLPKADSVISGIPLSNLSHKKINVMLQTAKHFLKPGGNFVQFQYSLRNYRDIKNVFGKALIKFEYRNLPPAFVYVCRNASFKAN